MRGVLEPRLGTVPAEDRVGVNPPENPIAGARGAGDGTIHDNHAPDA